MGNLIYCGAARIDVVVLEVGSHVEGQPLKLWYDKAADAKAYDSPDDRQDDLHWLNALPLGNGSLGAMVFGGTNHERIQLSEESVWSGGPECCDNPEAAKYLDEIKSLLFAGKYREATALAKRSLICIGAGSNHGKGASAPFGCFQTLGDLWIDFQSENPVMNYRRELRLDDVSMVVCYEQNGISYRRDLFVSYPDQVFVMRLKADCPRSLDFKCRLTRPELFATRAEGDQLVMYGTLSNGKGGDGLNYIARLKALAKGGEVVCTDSALYVKNADEVVLLLAASTDYKLEYPHYRGRDCVNLTRRRIDKAARKTYEQLYLSHKADYSQYYDRVELDLIVLWIRYLPTGWWLPLSRGV